MPTIAVDCRLLPSVTVCWCDGLCRPLPSVAVCWRPPLTDHRYPYGSAPPLCRSVSFSPSSSRLSPCSSQDLGKNPTESLQVPAVGFRLFAGCSRLNTNLDAGWVLVCMFVLHVHPLSQPRCVQGCSCCVRGFLDWASPACKPKRSCPGGQRHFVGEGPLTNVPVTTTFKYLGIDIVLQYGVARKIASRRSADLVKRCSFVKCLPRSQRGACTADAIAALEGDLS